MAAAEHKEKGNAAFKAGDYPTAIGHYTSAILADGTDPTFPLNRAAAYLKLNKNEDAERDCSTTLKLQPNNVKALFRRAQARVAVGKLSEARADLVAAAKAEPGNTAVRAEFTKVEGLIAEEAKKAKAGKGIPISLPTHAPAPSDSSGPPYRRRVPIAIVNDDEPEENKEAEAAKPKTTPSRTVAPPKSILKNATVSSDHQPGDSPTVSKPDTFLTPVSTRSLSSSGPPSHKDPAPDPAYVSSSATLTGPSPPPISPGKPAASPAVVTAASPEPAASAPLPNKGSEEPSSAFPLQPDSAPPTLLVFLQKWSNTRTDADRASVLFAVPPSSIPSLFGPTLESPLLGAMLSALSWALASAANLPTADIPRRTLAYMSALAQVPRFSTLLLFLDVAEKKSAKDVWDGLEQSGVEADIGKEKKKWAC